MAEAIQARVENAVKKSVEELDREHLRKMQANMYKCCTKCCETPSYTMEGAQRCIEQCSLPLQQAQTYVQNELGEFQDRLQRCAMQCQDDLKDLVARGNTNEAMMRSHLEQCLSKCADKHIGILPAMMARMKDTISKYK
ncbi:protein FAM136A-like [Ptychodera flava]|uniref:protein FAM136A-like n=1 Tax=Ptychodera flava TaxID=63121 RepID=UPI003969D42B